MLKNKTAVITGGSRGIGAAVAKALAERGANVAILYAGNAEAADKTVKECEAYGVKAMAWQCNVADAEAVKTVVGEIRKSFDSVDMLVNNAGITKDGLVLMMKEDAFNDVIDVNLRGAFHMIRHVAPLMVRGKFGRILLLRQD